LNAVQASPFSSIQVVAHAWPPPNTPLLAFSSVSLVFSDSATDAGGPAGMTTSATIDCAFPASYTLPDADTIRNMVAGALRSPSVIANLTTVASDAANAVSVVVCIGSPTRSPPLPSLTRTEHASLLLSPDMLCAFPCSLPRMLCHLWLSAWAAQGARPLHLRICCHGPLIFRRAL
jgi:hypothetical protein